MKEKRVPELLAPAGSPEALSAAIAAGADAVYFGAKGHNARMGAKNFTLDEMRGAIALCHAHGVKAHVTINTQIYDRELDDALRTAERAYLSGADALIVADLGLSGLLREYFPDMELHASTQCSGASARDAAYLASLGFARMVCARELSGSDIARLVKDSPIDVEMFVHGAICVSASGQCLYSSLVGGRSGNRGECAQPCRLPYNGGHPLSPKDMCLAKHMREIIDTGVCSLKIEGRMKSPDYVYRVTSLYRKLLDERRGANADEISSAASAFSRSGFTDSYFTGRVKSSPNEMIGVRTDEDKALSRDTASTIPTPEKVRIDSVSAVIRACEASRLTLSANGRTVTVAGGEAQTAKTQSLTADEVRARLSKLGGTPFTADAARFDIDVGDRDGGAFLTVSSLNELRRRAVAALTDALSSTAASERTRKLPANPLCGRHTRRAEPNGAGTLRTAEFLRPSQISERAREFFDTIYLPLEAYDASADGFVMPPVVFDREEDEIKQMANDAARRGARSCVIANAGQAALVKGLPLLITAGFRFNVCNTESALAAASAGAELVTVSPELTARQTLDIARCVRAAATVYGRLPLMVTERCIIRAVSGDKCICGDAPVLLTDRRGVGFPMYRGFGCRTVIYNSVPIYMADKRDELSRMECAAHHFMFTTEDMREVDLIIERYENGIAPENNRVRRIG